MRKKRAPDKLLTTVEAARVARTTVNLCPDDITTACRSGALRARKSGRQWRINRRELNRWLAATAVLIAWILGTAAIDAYAQAEPDYTRIYLKSGDAIHEIALIPYEDGNPCAEHEIILPVNVAGGTLQYGTFEICTRHGVEATGQESAIKCSADDSVFCPGGTLTTVLGPGPHSMRWSRDGSGCGDTCDEHVWPPFIISNPRPILPPGCAHLFGN